jgi:hypothetical protein
MAYGIPSSQEMYGAWRQTQDMKQLLGALERPIPQPPRDQFQPPGPDPRIFQQDSYDAIQRFLKMTERPPVVSAAAPTALSPSDRAFNELLAKLQRPLDLPTLWNPTPSPKSETQVLPMFGRDIPGGAPGAGPVVGGFGGSAAGGRSGVMTRTQRAAKQIEEFANKYLGPSAEALGERVEDTVKKRAEKPKKTDKIRIPPGIIVGQLGTKKEKEDWSKLADMILERSHPTLPNGLIPWAATPRIAGKGR